MATGAGDNTAKIWSLPNFEHVHTLNAHQRWKRGRGRESRDGEFASIEMRMPRAKWVCGAMVCAVGTARQEGGREGGRGKVTDSGGCGTWNSQQTRTFSSPVGVQTSQKLLDTREGSSDNSARSWNVTQGEAICSFNGHQRVERPEADERGGRGRQSVSQAEDVGLLLTLFRSGGGEGGAEVGSLGRGGARSH
eukprot:757174-Hanusia_phi.AAC.1